jgi:hypothetical protein
MLQDVCHLARVWSLFSVEGHQTAVLNISQVAWIILSIQQLKECILVFISPILELSISVWMAVVVCHLCAYPLCSPPYPKDVRSVFASPLFCSCYFTMPLVAKQKFLRPLIVYFSSTETTIQCIWAVINVVIYWASDKCKTWTEDLHIILE